MKKFYAIRVLVTLLFFIFSTLFYCLSERWSIVDSILFIVCTITTVGNREASKCLLILLIMVFYRKGYGYVTPSSDLSRLVTVCVIFFGTQK